MDLSICIPSFNSEKYISCLLDSIISQLNPNVEVICLDDGSTDSTLDILNKYSKTINNLNIVSTKNNGPSVARNILMKKAKGRYIFFIDSDDILDSNAINKILYALKDNDFDILRIGIESFSDDDKFKKRSKEINARYKQKSNYKNIMSGPHALINFIENGDYQQSACINIVKTEFLREEKIRFYPCILHEDNLYTYKLFLRARQVFVLNETLYYRRVRELSITTSPKNYMHAYGLFICYVKMIEFLSKNNNLLLLDERIIKPIIQAKDYAIYIYMTLNQYNKNKLLNSKLKKDVFFCASILTSLNEERIHK